MNGQFGIVVKGSRPGTSYQIKFGNDGVLYCTCPSWKFSPAPLEQRTCKHMKLVKKELEAK
jgi:hypothetical protein